MEYDNSVSRVVRVLKARKILQCHMLKGCFPSSCNGFEVSQTGFERSWTESMARHWPKVTSLNLTSISHVSAICYYDCVVGSTASESNGWLYMFHRCPSPSAQRSKVYTNVLTRRNADHALMQSLI